MEEIILGAGMLSKKQAKELGPELLKAADERWKKMTGEAVIAAVEELRRQKRVAESNIEEQQKLLAECDRKLTAIRDGNFQITRDFRIVA